MRLEVINNNDRRIAVLMLEDETSNARQVLVAACNKLRLNARKCRLFGQGAPLEADAPVQAGPPLWLVSGKDAYQGPAPQQFDLDASLEGRVEILDGADVWIDPEAVEQVHRAVRNAPDDILRAVGLPDLHHGPTGVAILARRPLPKLPGYDIGCGMALFATRISAATARDKVARCMARLDLDVGEDPADPYLGTIGGGNHFAELLVVDPFVPVAEEVQGLFSPDHAVLLVHSGSRAHGARVFAEHSDGHDPEGYMKEHMELVEWARRNRATIAARFLRQFAGGGGGGSGLPGRGVDAGQAGQEGLATQAGQGGKESAPPEGSTASSAQDVGVAAAGGTGGNGPSNAAAPAGPLPTPLVDIAHNWIEHLPDGTFLHRKGAAPSHAGSLSLLPGSRATASYVLVCHGQQQRDLNSVAHGAGRRLSRADARRSGADSSGAGFAAAAGGGPRSGDLTRGGTVVCGNKELLLEEAPHAYKDVEAVVTCMVERSMCSVGARLLPIATYKTRGSMSGG